MMTSCWYNDPEERLTFAQISEMLDQYLEELAGYMNIQMCLFPEIQLKQDPEGAQLRDKGSCGRKRSNSFQLDMRADEEQFPTMEGNGRKVLSMVAPWKSEQLL